jgi:nucleoside-diphosphate-sugar epimerase
LIVNAVGPGNPQAIRKNPAAIEAITAQYDRLVLDHLQNRPETGYVFLSTGAVYGSDYCDADRPRVLLETPPDDLAPWDRYPRAKLLAEARHRAASGLHVADLRIYGYVSRFIDREAGFLLSGIARALTDRVPFVTGSDDFARDYIGPGDLAGLIRHLMELGIPNGVYDAVSAGPTTKHALLNCLAERFGLRIRVTDAAGKIPAGPGPHSMVFPHPTAQIGYKPRLTSVETVSEEFEAMIAASRTPGRPTPRRGKGEMLCRCQS